MVAHERRIMAKATVAAGLRKWLKRDIRETTFVSAANHQRKATFVSVANHEREQSEQRLWHLLFLYADLPRK